MDTPFVLRKQQDKIDKDGKEYKCDPNIYMHIHGISIYTQTGKVVFKKKLVNKMKKVMGQVCWSPGLMLLTGLAERNDVKAQLVFRSVSHPCVASSQQYFWEGIFTKFVEDICFDDQLLSDHLMTDDQMMHIWW